MMKKHLPVWGVGPVYAVICALLTGHVVKFFNKRLLKPLNGILQA